MNRTYKLVWNTISQAWMVASELAKGDKKSGAAVALLLKTVVLSA